MLLSNSALLAEEICPFPPSTIIKSGYGHSSCVSLLLITSLIMAKSFGTTTGGLLILNLLYSPESFSPLVKTTIEPVANFPEIFEMS